MRVRPSEVLFAACLAVAAGTFVVVLCQPLPWLFAIVPDDAFYYLQIARNLATKHVSSFDGTNLTNGYHPGWMGILTLLAALVGDRTALIYAALTTAMAFHVATSFCLARALVPSLGRDGALVGAALWLINPLALTLVLSGMEASFYIFALSFGFLTYETRIAPALDAERDVPRSDLVRFGLALSLCFYGRTEATVLVGAVILGLGWAQRRRSWFPAMLVTGAAFAAGTIPWFLFSHAATHTWFQRSGAMKMLWANEAGTSVAGRAVSGLKFALGSWASYPMTSATGFSSFLKGIAGHGAASPAAATAASAAAPASATSADPTEGLRALVNGAVTAAIAVAIVLGLRGPRRRFAGAGAVVLTGSLGTGLVYGFLFADRQYWYKAQPAIVLFVVLYAAVAIVVQTRWPRATRGVAAVAVLVMFANMVTRIATLQPYPWQRDVVVSQKTFDVLVPDGESIGCFNAGMAGYFSKHAIINLDGLVNNSIYEYYRRREVDQYLRDSGIHFIADEKTAIARATAFSRRPIGLEVIATAPMQGANYDTRYLWRVTDGPVSSVPSR